MQETTRAVSIGERPSDGVHLLSTAPAWLIEQDGFDPASEGEMETIFTLGNGYLGVRGALVDPLPASQADMFIAGLFAPKILSFPYSEVGLNRGERARGLHVELAPFPFPFRLALTIGDRALDFEEVDVTRFERVLDLRQGKLYQYLTFRDTYGYETALRATQCASLSDPHLLLQDVEIQTDNPNHPLTVNFSLIKEDFLYTCPHLELMHASKGSLASLDALRTQGSNYLTAIGFRMANGDNEMFSDTFTVPSGVEHLWRFRKMVSIFTSRESQDPIAATRTHLLKKNWRDWEHYWQANSAAWSEYWNKADMVFPGRPDIEEAKRFNSYHLRIAADHDHRVSVGARGLSGRSYEGHVFWDTEIYAWPFYLYSEPDIALHQLMYRYTTLDGARRRALSMGCVGACYAWESTVTGDDVTPSVLAIEGTDTLVPIFTGERQIHVTADVAHAVTQYWRATKDDDFMRRYGAEILFETARFWASRAVLRDHEYHLDHVIGPDEYHIDVNDNAFTNWMARENLRSALACFEKLYKQQTDTLPPCHREEREQWLEVAERLFQQQPNANGVIEQFEGFFDLQPPHSCEMLSGAAALFDWQEINRLRLCKQADVLMIPFLFPGVLPTEVVRANFNYYEPITNHASSLSRPVHAGIAAQIGNVEKARKYWNDALFIDLSGRKHNTSLGFHVATAGGVWQALVFHMLGVAFAPDGWVRNSRAILPEGCEGVSFELVYQGKVHKFDFRPEEERWICPKK